LIFAKVTLAEDLSFLLYKTMSEIIFKQMPKPDLYIYLYQSTERLLENIKERGRSYEQEIPAAYLEKINNGYLDYIKSQHDLTETTTFSNHTFSRNTSKYVSPAYQCMNYTISRTFACSLVFLRLF